MQLNVCSNEFQHGLVPLVNTIDLLHFFKSSRILLPNLLSGKFLFHDYFPVSLEFFRLKNVMINIIHVLIITYIHRILYVHRNAYAYE